MRRLLWLVLAVGFVIGADKVDDAAKKEMTKLEGTWIATLGEEEGNKAPEEELKKMKLVFKGDKFTATAGDRLIMEGTLQVDPTKKPRAVDLKSTKGRLQGQTGLGIYELDGDTLKLCLVEPTRDRPSDFTSKAGSGRHFLVYKRQKP